MERDHGALLRRADTTTQATAPIRASRNGLFVRMAQIAKPAAHNHHATGCRERRLGTAARVIPRPASGAIGRGRSHRGRRRRLRPGRPGGDCSRSPRRNRGTRRWPRRAGGRRTILGAARRTRSSPRAPSVVVVAAGDGRCRGRGPLDFDRVLTAVLVVVAAGAGPALAFRRCRRRGRRGGRRCRGRRGGAAADGAWVGGTSVEALQICA